MKKMSFLALLLLITTLVYAQDVPTNIVGQKLPYTWEIRMQYGIMRSTMNEDGSIVTQMIMMCGSCYGNGRCYFCGGRGVYMGMSMACGSCKGGGMCPACWGRGYTVMNTSTSKYGGTIGYDERGNKYVASSISGSYGTNSDNTRVWHCCDKTPTFGNDLYHDCSKCGQRHKIGTHFCVVH